MLFDSINSITSDSRLRRRDVGLLAAALVVGSLAAAPNAACQPTADSSATAVRAVELPSANDGQQTWLLEQTRQRVPEIPGLAERLPYHIEKRLEYAFDLAQRGATYTAADEFKAALRLCAQELDARENGTRCREALNAGWVAINEADEFTYSQQSIRDSLDVRRLAVGHTTPGVKEATQPVGATEAIQRYYSYAEQQLTEACKGLPRSSVAYYGLGRVYGTPGREVLNPRGKAALLHRTALDIAPKNSLAANELGVLLAQHGQLDVAQALFEHALGAGETSETWRNLAVVYERQGDMRASRTALASAERIEAASHAEVAARDASRQEQSDQMSEDEGESKPSGFLAQFQSLRLPSLRSRGTPQTK